jgi:hypothetical protein
VNQPLCTPHTPLPQKKYTQITEEELLTASLVTPDFEVLFKDRTDRKHVVSSGSMAHIGGQFELACNEQRKKATALMNDFEKWNVKVTTAAPDAPRMMDVLNHRNDRFLFIDNIYKQFKHSILIKINTKCFMKQTIKFHNPPHPPTPHSTVAAGTMFYRSNKDNKHHKVEFNNCGGRVGSYSGAYLISRNFFAQTDYSIKNHLEAASLTVFG